MEVYQISATCSECQFENRVIITEENLSALCEKCGAQVVKAKRFPGVIYVMSNPRVHGVKIGLTSKNVFSRARQISGTGVPGTFAVIAAFPSNNPGKDERKVFEKLIRKKISKEHFDLDPVTAVLKVRSILGKDWVYLNRKFEREVKQRLDDQRASATKRFAGAAPESTQINMFDDAVECQSLEPEIRPASEPPPKPKGFLSNLFN